MKKLLKWALIGIGVLVGIGTLSVVFLSQEKPTGSNPKAADELAQNMLKALDKPGFDTLKYLRWNFADRQKYLWDKQGDKVIVKWDNVEVLLDLKTQNGDVFVDGKILQNDEKSGHLEKAWSNWCNDSFWMIAPFKVFDPGTTREIVNDEGQTGLMVKYDSGGVTPGDSYLWLLDENNIPTGYKMWVKIIPIGGTYASWDNWKKLDCGAFVATTHEMKLFTLNITDIKEGNSYKDFGYTTDPFILLD